MTNIHQFEAGYLLNQLLINLSHLFNGIGKNHLSLAPLLIISLLLTLLAVIRKLLIIKISLNEQSMLLELTPPSFTEQEAYTTDQLFSVIHSIGIQRTIKERILGIKSRFSLEIVSNKKQGIRYLVRTSPKQINTLKKSLLSYLPYLKVNTVNEYLPKVTDDFNKHYFKIMEFNLSKNPAFSLRKQTDLDRHDPIAYVTGMMTKLEDSEMISLQIVLTPKNKKGTEKVSKLIASNGDVIKYLKLPGLLKWILFNSLRVPHTKSPSELETVSLIDSKINSPLFKSTIRILMVTKNKSELAEREQGFKSAFSTFSLSGYQSLRTVKAV